MDEPPELHCPNTTLIKVMISVQVLTAVALLIISLAPDALTAHLPFHPRKYPKKVASCPAINRAENTRVDIELCTPLLLLILWH